MMNLIVEENHYMEERIAVSIVCVTYNHSKYIRKTLDGFFMQKTSFRYEVIIHDDASTDGTIDILKEYKKRYPDKVFLFLEEENQYSKGIKIQKTFLWPNVKGKYIAVCDGDDYWIYDYKLQKQYDWMEAHPKTNMCIHNAIRYDENSKEIIPQIIDMDSGYIDDEEMISCRHGLVPTASFFFRASYIRRCPHFFDICPVVDQPLRYWLGYNGDIYYMDKVWAVRNYMHAGSWNYIMNNNMDEKQNMNFKYLNFLLEFNDITEHRFEQYIKEKQIWHCMAELLVKPLEEFICEEFLDRIEFCKKQHNYRYDNLFDFIRAQYIRMCKDFSQQLIKLASDKNNKFFIYGAGVEARKCADKLLKNNVDFEGFVVTQKKYKEEKYMHHKVYGIDELNEQDKNVFFWLGMNDKNRKEVIPLLMKRGFKNVL